jgi:gliding motility-associated-like protein
VRAVFIFCLLLVCYSVSGQKEGNIWYFGNKAGVDFNSGSPVAVFSSAMNTGHGCACISDRCSGEMLFYTDGTSVWDSTNQIMPNGNGLLGDRLSTQSAIIVPHPDTTTHWYYIFTVQQSGSGGIHYSVVDMTLNAGKGDIITGQKNRPLVTPTVEKLTAVKHQNNSAIWVITHKLGTDEFYAYLIDGSGLNTTPVISSTGAVYNTNAIKGYLKASPDGRHLAAAIRNENTFELLEFDNATGIVSNANRFPANYPGAYGVEFSSDGTKLYATVNSNGLYQFDLNAGSAAAISASAVKLSGNPSVALQLGPDQKIYTNEGRWLGVINDPNQAGLACNYVQQAVYLGATVFGNSGLPTFLQSYFSPIGIAEENICLGSATSFSILNLANVDSLEWNFGEPVSGAANTSTLLNPTHTYASAGTYTVSLIYYGRICKDVASDTVTKEITIIDVAAPIADLGADTTMCDGQSVLLDASFTQSSYRWQDGSTDSVYLVESPGTYWVEITNTCGEDRDTVEVGVFTSNLQVDLGGDTTFCQGHSTVLDAGQLSDASYAWQDGSSDNTYFVNSAGKYWVTVSDRCRSISDTITISTIRAPEVSLGNDTVLCPGNQLILNATTDEAEYAWQDGSTKAFFLVEEEGRYMVSVANRCGQNRAIIDVDYEDCSCTVFVPSAFTPNGDQLNNRFEVVYNCDFTSYQLQIFNRWGELIYETTNPRASWDGTSNGNALPNGKYLYLLKYRAMNNTEELNETIRGELLLLK